MGHDPKKVFIKENGTYAALSYEAFCQHRLQHPEDWDRFFLPIQGCLLEVDQEDYRAFYREKGRARYLERLEQELGILSLEEIDLDREVIRNPFQEPEKTPEELVLSQQLTSQLREAVSQLRPAERKLLFQLYCENRTERELAEQYGVYRNAIHKRKVRILKKLKNFLHW